MHIKPTQGIIVTILLSLIVTAGCAQTPNSISLSATFTQLAGDVEQKASGQNSFAPATNGMALDINGQAQTGDNGKARLDLSTGTFIRVVPSSIFTLQSNAPANNNLSTTLNLLTGQIFIVLNGGSLDVNTPSGVASVRGSYMMVQIDPTTKEIIITCLEGHCQAQSQNGTGAVSFTDGQKCVLPPANGQASFPQISRMTSQDFQEWQQDVPEAASMVSTVMAELGGGGSGTGISMSACGQSLGSGNTGTNCGIGQSVSGKGGSGKGGSGQGSSHHP